MRFLRSQQTPERPVGTESLDDIEGNMAGTVTDLGKSLEKYREDRTQKRYDTTGQVCIIERKDTGKGIIL